jgi:hypothetical protein
MARTGSHALARRDPDKPGHDEPNEFAAEQPHLEKR